MKKIMLLAAGAIVSLLAHAQKSPAPWKQKERMVLLENKGQIKDQFGVPRADIQFKIASKDINVFIGNGQIHYQWYHTDALPKDLRLLSQNKVTAYRMDVALEGADPHARIVTEEEQQYQEYFYLQGSSSNRTAAHAFRKVTYKDIYPGIDWVFYISRTALGEEALKYEFVVRPGADPGKIRLKYKGATGLQINANGSLSAHTPLGHLEEEAPYSYVQQNKDAQIPVSSRFILKDDVLQFNIASYSGTLIIDPALDWGTYYGGYGFDLGTVLSCDNAGNVYVTGASYFSMDIATTGSYQYTSAGDFDAFLVKFNKDGDRIWATYFGGPSVDYGFGLTCDRDNNIYLSGQTQSASGIATSGSYQPAKNPAIGTDAFLVKFDSSGARLWATYFGGPGDDDGGFCAYDSKGYVYLSGATSSVSNIASGGFQSTYGGGTRDGFLAKFDTAGTFQWATYYGGSGDDQAEGVASDGDGNVYIGGHTNSTSGIATTTSHQPAISGGYDDFVVKFDSTGARAWGTYYGGVNNEYTGGFHTVACDKHGGVFLAGHSSSTSGIATSGSYQAALSGGTDAFLVKFNTAGVRTWATYYGGSDDDFGGAISCDAAGDIYWCGITHSANNMASTGAYQTVYGGAPSDAFLAKFDNSGNRIYGTYYGGASLDEAYAVAFDNEGNAYISGGTVSPAGIATPGSFLTNYNGGIAVFLAKFCAGAIAAPPGGDDSVCAHSTNVYTIPPIPGATGYIWDLPSGWTGVSDSSSITATAGTSGGVITVQVIKCDTLSETFTVYVWPENPAIIARNGAVLSTANTHLSYQWLRNGQLLPGATQDTLLITQNGQYTVVVTNEGGCTDTSAVMNIEDITAILGLNLAGIQVSFWPNPAMDYININASVPVNLEVCSMDGRVLLQSKRARKVNLGILAEGVYLLRFSDEHSRLIKVDKLVKVRQ